MIKSVNDFNSVFFIGIAGVGMSAIAQWLAAEGKTVSGSDRYFVPNQPNEIREKLEAEGIACFEQNGEGIHAATQLVVVSTAIEDTVAEVKKAKELQIPIIRRSELLAIIAAGKKTIAVGGTSGKSTSSAMLFQIMEAAGMEPGIISGAGLVSLIKQGKLGNAKNGKGPWLIIEADESDGSIVQYRPQVGLLLNIDKDHQEIDELMQLFGRFQQNTTDLFVVNQGNALAKQLSLNAAQDFSGNPGDDAGYRCTSFNQQGMKLYFAINKFPFLLQTVGRHNMENALAAVAVAHQLGVNYKIAALALKGYEGIYRRHQLLGIKNNITVIDDYAHNPAKCAASIKACQPLAPKVVAWFQPHGYGPTRFLRKEFVQEIADALRDEDEIWMSEIFYAGGTAVKDISAADLINDIKALGKNAFFVEDRNLFLSTVSPHLQSNTVLLLMGARDPSLETFAKNLFEQL